MTFYPEQFFPQGRVTTRFGWDKDPPGPRIHHAIDKAGPGILCLPFAAERVEWVDRDGQGNSVLRAFADGLELRLLHFRKAELSPGLVDAAEKGRGLPAGQPIGPAGDVGIGTGRHTHYSVLLEPGIHDATLYAKRPGWRVDQSREYRDRYGLAFAREMAAREIFWMSEVALEKRDPWTGKRKIIVDSMVFFGF